MFSVQAIDLESNQLQCVQAIWTFIDSIEKIAAEQYDRTAAIASEQVCACARARVRVRVCTCAGAWFRSLCVCVCDSLTV